MAINLNKVSVSLAEFQKISSGTHNAGEVTLKNEHSLDKVNHHVGALRGRNKVAIPHEQIVAVKKAFVGALGAGGVSDDELNRVRAELGLGLGGAEDNLSLRERNIRPLTRQQVREILDRYADTLNAHDGPGTIRTQEQLSAGLSPKELESRRQLREAANAAIPGRRRLEENRDIALFARLVSGDFAGVSRDDAARMVEMARSKIAAARAKHPGALPTNDARTLVARLELENGQTVDFSVRRSTASFVARMEDAIFALKHSPVDGEGRLAGAVPPKERNEAIRDALAYPEREDILPHDVRGIVDEMLAGARQKFGAGIVPEGARLSSVATNAKTWERINALGTENPVGPDTLRGALEGLLVESCMQRAADHAIEQEAARQGVMVPSPLGMRFLQREPQLAAALRDAADAGGVATAFTAFRDQLQRFVAFAAAVTSFTRTGFYEAAVDKLAAGLGNGIPRSSLLAQIRNWADVGPAVDEMGAKIISGEIPAESLEDVERLFRDKAAEMMGRRIDLFRSIDGLRDELPRQLSDRFKTDALRMQSFDPKTYNIGAFVAVAKKPAFASALATLNATLSKPGLDREEGYAALRTFYDGLLELVESELGEHVYGFDTQTQAFQAVLRIATKGDEAPLKAAHDFFLRDDVANDDLHMKPFVSAIQLMNSLSFGGVTNDDILDALDKGGLAPMHAKALADAVRDSGIAGLDGDRAVALFATANPAGRALAEVIRSAPDGISPQELYSFAISVLRDHAGAIADKTAATKLFVPLDAREIADAAYRKAGDDPARADRLVAAAFAACGTDADLRRIVRDNLDEILVGSSAALRSEEKVRERVEGIRGNLAELRQIARSARRPEDLLRIGYDFLSDANAVFPRGTLTRAFQVLLKLPVDALVGLATRSGVRDIHRALVQVEDNVGRLSAVLGKVLSGPEQQAAFRFLVQRTMLLSATQRELAAIHDAIRSRNAANLEAGYGRLRGIAEDREDEEFSDGLVRGIDQVAQRLRLRLGELNAQICLARGMDLAQNQIEPADPAALAPADYDADGLLADIVPYARTELAAEKERAIGAIAKGDGPAAQGLRAALSEKMGPEPDSPAERFAADMRSVVRTLLNRNVARDLRRFARNRPTSFERDLAAGMNITLPGVGRVSADPAEARNQFARFVSGDPGATYDALDPVARKKAQIAMAFASKARAGEAWTAFGVALHPDNIAQAAGFNAESASECTVALNLAENGALEVSFVIRRRPAQMQVGGAVYDCGPGSEATAEVDIRVEPEEMERLVGQDFADYDDTPVADFLRTPVEDREENFYLGARQAIPENYRIEMPVEVKVSADLR